MTMRRVPRRTRRRTDSGTHRVLRPELSFPAPSLLAPSFPAPLSPARMLPASSFPATSIAWGMPTR